MVTKKKPVKVANPDCDVATKGYVKRIARSVYRHEHTVNSRLPPISACLATVGWMSVIVAFAARFSVEITLPIILFAGACTAFVIDHGSEDPSTYDKITTPNDLKAWEEPKEKEDCL